MFYRFIVAFCFFGGSFAELYLDRSCPEVKTVKDFNVTAYMGYWFEARKLFLYQEIGVKCIKVHCKINADDSIRMHNTWVSSVLGSRSHVDATATMPSPFEPAKMKVKYPRTPLGHERNYWVVGTDYTSYAVIYRCENITPVRSEISAWILTREQHPTYDVLQKAFEVTERLNILQSDLLMADQTECTQDLF